MAALPRQVKRGKICQVFTFVKCREPFAGGLSARFPPLAIDRCASPAARPALDKACRFGRGGACAQYASQPRPRPALDKACRYGRCGWLWLAPAHPPLRGCYVRKRRGQGIGAAFGTPRLALCHAPLRPCVRGGLALPAFPNSLLRRRSEIGGHARPCVRAARRFAARAVGAVSGLLLLFLCSWCLFAVFLAPFGCVRRFFGLRREKNVRFCYFCA